MHLSAYMFVAKVLEMWVNRYGAVNILDVGAYNVNGSIKDWISNRFENVDYIGLDLFPQYDYVDIVGDASYLPFSDNAFDIVISTEVLEHVYSWKSVISELIRVLKLGGLLIITTRSPGFPLHSYPHDYWRYTIEDFKNIFRDMRILFLQDDPQSPGVFLAAVKIKNLTNLVGIPIYSMIFCREFSGDPPLNLHPKPCFSRKKGFKDFFEALKKRIKYLSLYLSGVEPILIPELASIENTGSSETGTNQFLASGIRFLDRLTRKCYILSQLRGSLSYRYAYEVLSRENNMTRFLYVTLYPILNRILYPRSGSSKHTLY